MMKFIELTVRTKQVVHGYNSDNWEIKEECNEENYVKKMIAIERIQSVSEDFILVTSSHDRVMYWQYEESYDEVRTRLQIAGHLL